MFRFACRCRRHCHLFILGVVDSVIVFDVVDDDDVVKQWWNRGEWPGQVSHTGATTISRDSCPGESRVLSSCLWSPGGRADNDRDDNRNRLGCCCCWLEHLTERREKGPPLDLVFLLLYSAALFLPAFPSLRSCGVALWLFKIFRMMSVEKKGRLTLILIDPWGEVRKGLEKEKDRHTRRERYVSVCLSSSDVWCDDETLVTLSSTEEKKDHDYNVMLMLKSTALWLIW